MRVFLDTSVLVAALVEGHPHHHPASALFAPGDDLQITISAHGMAELYSVLTRAPFSPRIHPAEAWQMIESLLARVNIVALDVREYREVVQECSRTGWAGGAVYDVLHIHTAQKAGCKRLYTFNVREFRALAPEDFRERIAAP